MDTDFKLAATVFRVAQRHVRKGTPIEQAWPEVVKAGERGLGAKVSKAALGLPVTDSLVTVASEYASLLGRDKPGKGAKSVGGLWFGLVELLMEGEAIWTPYIAGARKFSPTDQDWPVNPVWLPEDCFAPNAAMTRLSGLRARYPKQHWLIETSLIEPLHALIVGSFVRNTTPSVLRLHEASVADLMKETT